jgi:hypothetical protein
VIASGRNNYGAIGSLAAPGLDPVVLLFALGSVPVTRKSVLYKTFLLRAFFVPFVSSWLGLRALQCRA